MTLPIVNILEAYDLVPPIETFTLNGQGVNNAAIGIRTGKGKFVLKTYHAQDDLAVIEYEHRLLSWLSHVELPFVVPSPLPTRNGKTIRDTLGGRQALFMWLPGTSGNRSTLMHLSAAGHALGALHQVLSKYQTDPRPGVAPFGDLNHIHQCVPNSITLLSDQHTHDQSFDETLLKWWHTEINILQAFIEHDYEHLPRQVIHGDFTMGNLLFQADHLTAVLDWEFAVPDVRMMDVATLLMSISISNLSNLQSGTKLIGHSYRTHVQPTKGEIEALPWLIRLWNVVNLIWHVGQCLGSGQKHLHQTERLLRARQMGRWLEHHADDLTKAFLA
jgi:homoserine kinase type II